MGLNRPPFILDGLTDLDLWFEPISQICTVLLCTLEHSLKAVARGIKSSALMADSKQTELCTYLSGILLAGLLLNALFGWWWSDPVAALIMVPIIAKEGLEALRGENCCDDDCSP